MRMSRCGGASSERVCSYGVICGRAWLRGIESAIAKTRALLEYTMDAAKWMQSGLPYHPENGFAKQSLELYVFLLACFVIPLVLLKLILQRPKYNLPPSPPAYPIFGHLHLLGKLPHQSMAHLAKTYGEVYSLRLGSVPAIVVTTPAMAKEFLQTHDKVWASRPTRIKSGYYFSYNYSGIAFAPYTPVWRNLRKICMLELFTQRRMEASQGVRDEEMRYMIRSVLHDTQQGQVIDFKLKLHALSANVIARIVLNKRFTGCMDSTAAEEVEAHEFKEMIEEFFILQGTFMIGDYLPWLYPLDFGGTEKRMKALRVRLDHFLDEIIHEHEAKRAKGAIAEEDKDMIDVLLNEMEGQAPEDGSRIDLNNIKSTILNMFAGGTDTSTVTMEWAMSELLRNPSTLKKLQAELDTVVGKERLVQETDVPQLPYLQAVIKETFRLHPVGPLLIPHESTHDCKVGKYEIPAGTRLYVNSWAIGRNAWDRPLEFDPERFMTGPDVNIDIRGQDFRLLPFGSGRRSCPAIPLGLLTVQRITATLVHAFDWTLPPGEQPKDMDMTEAFGLTVPRANALYAVATPRQAARLY